MRIFNQRSQAAPSDTVRLTHDQRVKSRQSVQLASGETVGLNLPRGSVLQAGECLADASGASLMIEAANERLLRASTPDPHLLTRAAYHLGNRHTRIEISAEHLQLEHDPVLADLLASLGLSVSEVMAPFNPEMGAYAGGHKHGHDATFAEDYALAQAAFQVHHKPVNDDFR
jgi:urease accessory protein